MSGRDCKLKFGVNENFPCVSVKLDRKTVFQSALNSSHTAFGTGMGSCIVALTRDLTVQVSAISEHSVSVELRIAKL
jgi:hypothetical protein